MPTSPALNAIRMWSRGVVYRLWLIFKLFFQFFGIFPYMVVGIFVWILTGRDIVEEPPEWAKKLLT